MSVWVMERRRKDYPEDGWEIYRSLTTISGQPEAFRIARSWNYWAFFWDYRIIEYVPKPAANHE